MLLVLVHAGGGAGHAGMLWTLVFRSRPRRLVEKAARSRSADRTVAVRSPALQRTHGLAKQDSNQYCTKPLNTSAPSYTNMPGEFRSPWQPLTYTSHRSMGCYTLGLKAESKGISSRCRPRPIYWYCVRVGVALSCQSNGSKTNEIHLLSALTCVVKQAAISKAERNEKMPLPIATKRIEHTSSLFVASISCSALSVPEMRWFLPRIRLFAHAILSDFALSYIFGFL